MGLKKANRTSFKKGIIPWNKGLTKETDDRLKIVSVKTSKTKNSKEWKETVGKEQAKKLSKKLKGLRRSPKTEFKKNQIPWNKNIRQWKGKEHIISEKTRNAMKKLDVRVNFLYGIKKRRSFEGKNNPNYGQGEKIIGDKNPNFRNWASREPYGEAFSPKLKEQIRKRDGYRCQQCFRHQTELKKKLDVHHIDFNKKNNHPSNLISLCQNCHGQTQFDRYGWINYFQNRLIEDGKING